MSVRDIGIRHLIPGVRFPDEIKEDENNRRYVETIVKQRTQVTPKAETLGDTLARTTPSLILEKKPEETPRETKELGKWKSQKELEDYMRVKPTMAQQLSALKEYHKPKINVLNYANKMAHKYSNEPTPVGLGNKYKSDTRTPVQKKRDAFAEKQKWINDPKKVEAFVKSEDPTKGAKYVEWYDRMAQEEAEHLNSIKRQTWNTGGRVGQEPKYVSAQDVKNVYKPKQPEATPVQVKQLHKRLQNHNERTGEFKRVNNVLNRYEDDHPYIKGMEEDLEEIDKKGKSWFSKHLRKTQW